VTDLAIGGAITAVPFLLIAKEPDLGTAITLVTILLGIAFVAGLRMKFVLILLAVAVLASPLVWRYALRDYQKSRISTFIDPELDPRGAGYQQIQARISVGSGGVFGKGFLKGTQGQLRFLPVAWNDFVFSVYAEEQGLVGVIVALALYLFVIVRSLRTARLAKDRLGAYLVMGFLSAFMFQVLYNVTMAAGLVPVRGFTLPLMSSGGSSMIATLAGFGLVLNVRMRRFTN
jgi:rod shape determining protein RodA